MTSVLNWLLYSHIGKWKELPPLKTKRYGCAATNIGDDTIFVLGGHDGTTELDSVEIHSTDVAVSNPIPPMGCNRHACVAGTLTFPGGSNSVMVVGGHDGRVSLETAERFDTRYGRWTELPPMRTSRRFDCAGSTAGNRLLVTGGHDGTHCMSSAEAFDPISNRWEWLPDMHVARFQFAAAAVGRRLYVLGGCDGTKSLDTAEVYDDFAGTWTDLPSMNSRRRGCAAATVNGLVFVFGGHDGVSSLNTAEMYDPADRAWTPLPAMKRRRFGCAANSLNNQIYVVGGADGNLRLDSVERFTVKTAARGVAGGAPPPIVVPSTPPGERAGSSGEVPVELVCPITCELMMDPVVTSDGHSFERKAVERWFAQFGEDKSPRSPVTNAPIQRKLFPNHNLRSMCRNFAGHEY
eukprot:CAMPEP_0194286268 /NCGR_PEP_ID=MMETSP0169-20130528/32182_1 /TAXON_ID=218684 /ORGANISM="Corethron pennatum, Strain L29A3" /LENGTH=406 /DNA_ID=CAMNT_0039032663 /DNA_START=29 /DNA_END=1249 /DNA_ORIENTATION=-